MRLLPDSFLDSERLLLLIGVAVLAAVYLALQTRRSKYAVRFTNIELLDKVAPSRPGWRRHVPAAAFLIALAAISTGFARPVQRTEVPSEQATIVLAIDTSLSMEATDVLPTRLEGAKQAAVSFIEDLPDQIRLGLISFNGVATVRVTPSHNHAAAVSAVESLQLGPATAVGEAIFTALDSLSSLAEETPGTGPPARIVVMSDGETTVGRPDDDAIAAAQEAGIAVSTIAFGTDRGSIVLPDQPNPIPVPVNEASLAVIAEGTGGQFYTAASTAELGAVYENIGSQIAFEEVELEITPTYVGLGLLFLLISAALSLLWFSRLP